MRQNRLQLVWQVIGVVTMALGGVCLLFAQPIQALTTVAGDGLIAYGETASTTPRWRTFNVAGSFGTEASTVSGALGRSHTLKTSPTKQEAVAGYVSSTGTLQIMCYDGTNWTNDWSVSVGGTGTTARFDITYEQTSGDVMVVYSTNAATTNELAYRTKAGANACGAANWSAATSLNPIRTSGSILWVRLESSLVAGSDTVGLAFSDSNSDLSAMLWTGSGWTIAEPAAVLEADLERVTAAGDVLTFDIAFEGTSGNFMVAWGPSDAAAICTAGNNCVRYARYTTSWQASAAVPTIADEATNIDISANPASNEIALAMIGNRGSDLSTGYWSGSAWTAVLDRDATATTPVAGSKLVATGWLTAGATTRSIYLYADSTAPTTNLSWWIGSGATSSAGTDFVGAPVPGAFRWLNIQTNPFSTDRLLLTFSDANSDLFAKQLVMTSTPAYTWSNADGSAALEATLAQATASPFSFAYWRFIPAAPGSLAVDIVDAGGAPIGSPSLSMSGVVASNSCQTTTGTLGTSSQKIRVSNTTAMPAWSLSVAATGGAMSSWSSGLATYDFNDSGSSGCIDSGDADTLGGQLSASASAATLVPQAGCSTSGLNVGSPSGFVEGATNSVTLLTASASTQTNCYWDMTNIALTQKIPSFQAPGNYNLSLTLTVVAN